MHKQYIAGDWGTSHLRLSLIDAASGTPLAKIQGPGISAIDKDTAPDVLLDLVSDWLQPHTHMPVMLCGMVGSNIGWIDAGYAQCPLSLDRLNQHLTHLETASGNVTIIPGIKCLSPTGAPDRMRGEETQILGALASHPGLCSGPHLLCLPGTHSKWVWMENGSVIHFITSVCGELYSLLGQHSVLLNKSASNAVNSDTAFKTGVARSIDYPHVDLLQLLFETRSRQLDGMLTQADAASFMSGLLIGRDIASATLLFKECLPALHNIVFIGNPALTALYLSAARQLGHSGDVIDGDDLSRAGIHRIYTQSV